MPSEHQQKGDLPQTQRVKFRTAQRGREKGRGSEKERERERESEKHSQRQRWGLCRRTINYTSSQIAEDHFYSPLYSMGSLQIPYLL